MTFDASDLLERAAAATREVPDVDEIVRRARRRTLRTRIAVVTVAGAAIVGATLVALPDPTHQSSNVVTDQPPGVTEPRLTPEQSRRKEYGLDYSLEATAAAAADPHVDNSFGAPMTPADIAHIQANGELAGEGARVDAAWRQAASHPDYGGYTFSHETGAFTVGAVAPTDPATLAREFADQAGLDRAIVVGRRVQFRWHYLDEVLAEVHAANVPGMTILSINDQANRVVLGVDPSTSDADIREWEEQFGPAVTIRRQAPMSPAVS